MSMKFETTRALNKALKQNSALLKTFDWIQMHF